MRVLVVDSCIRESSKTRIILNRFVDMIKKKEDVMIKTIYLNNNSKLLPLNDKLLEKRDIDCWNKSFNDEYYDFAKDLKDCDVIIVGAPFYDLCFPTIFKNFIEQTLIYNLTFVDGSNGVEGLTNCKKMIYFSVKGAENNDFNNIDIATPYLKGYCNMLGIKEFYSLSYAEIECQDLLQKLDNDLVDFYKKCF